ncbi:MAG TPA: alpha-E domain-containing protein [Bryobacteraceae bacterium]|nr:alpha-E domain-containing protein [Bryobacteraceae bacterium]
MLSRVGDSLYWMSRYLERAEHTARVIQVQLDLMLERGAGSDSRNWVRLARSLGVESLAADSAVGESSVQSLLHDTSERASIVTSIMGARENARQVREQITSEMWEQLNRLFHAVRNSSGQDVWAAGEFLHSIKEGAHLFQGITDSTMTHGEGWQFIQAGRFLERAVCLSILVSVHFHAFHHPDHWESERAYLEWIGLLRSCTAFEAYCKAYTAQIKPDRIAEFLVLHQSFPHSIRFSAEALEAAIKEIGREAGSRRSSHVERISGRLRATLRYGQIDEIMAGGLDTYLDGILRQCGQVHGAMHQTYVAYPIEAALEA